MTHFGYEESPRPRTAKHTPDKEFDGRFLLRINLQNFCKRKQEMNVTFQFEIFLRKICVIVKNNGLNPGLPPTKRLVCLVQSSE